MNYSLLTSALLLKAVQNFRYICTKLNLLVTKDLENKGEYPRISMGYRYFYEGLSLEQKVS